MGTLNAVTAITALRTRPDAARWQAIRWASPLLGVGAGVSTSFMQGWLAEPWSTLANSASPWLVVAFLVGCLQRGVPMAAVLGAFTCLGEVAGYYGASAARDFGVSAGFVAVWVVCGVVGGPVFGACGRLARGGGTRIAAAVGAVAPAATFLGEGIGSYWLRLGYHQDAVLYVAIGVLAGAPALALMRGRLLRLAITGLGILAVIGCVVVYGFVLGAVG